MNLKPILKTGVRLLKKHSTKLLAGGAIVSELFALYFVHKKAPVVKERLEALPDNATRLDKFKTAAVLYLPAIGMFFTSGACVIGCCAVGEMHAAAMANLAMISEARLSKYEDKMSEMIGEDKVKELKQAVAEEAVEKRSVLQPYDIVTTEHGGDLFFDEWSGRYFTSSWAYIKQAVADFNGSLGGVNMWGTVNDFYMQLDIPTIPAGGYAGWNVDYKLEIDRDDTHTPDGRPVGVLIYYTCPKLYNDRLPDIEQRHW